MSGGSAVSPRATRRIASNSSAGAAALSTIPSAPAMRASSSTSSSGSVGVEDHARRLALGLEPAAERDAVAVAQVVLEQHHVGALAGEHVGGVGDAGGGADRDHPGLGAEQHGQPRADGRLGVDDRDAWSRMQPSQACFNPI